MDYSDTYGSLDPADPLSMYGGDFYGYNDGYDPSLMGGGLYYFGGGDPNFENPSIQDWGDPNGGQPWQNNPAASYDSGFMDPTTGDWVANPGYDPSTINDLPNVNAAPDLNPDVGGQPTFYAGAFGSQGVPYDPSPIGTTLEPTDLGNGVYDTGTTFYGGKFGSQGVAYDPSPIGATLDPTQFPVTKQTVPYDPSPIGTTLDQRTSQQQKKTQPATRPPAQQQPSPSGGVGLGSVPGISAGLPSDQKFTYNPVSIARQGAPNATAPAPYDYQGQSVLGKLAGYAGAPTSLGQLQQTLGVPTSLTLRQQLGLTRSQNPFGQGQNQYDGGV